MGKGVNSTVDEGQTPIVTGGGFDAIGFHMTQDPVSVDEGVPTLGRTTGGMGVAENQRGKPGQGYPAALQGHRVRRLTPTECERLQGFPDGWTAIPGAKDGPRYAALGNSMAVPVMRWIGERIAKVDRILSERSGA